MKGLTETGSRISIPIVVVLERYIDPAKKWGYPTWRVQGILAGDSIPESSIDSTVQIDEHTCHFICTGYTLDLFKDGSEGYWYNLLSDQPYLFVICEGDFGSMEIRPMLVTANQDEANGHMESDDMVLSVPMPEAITDLLEHYVISHYKPEIKHKRKRRDWMKESLYAGDQNKVKGADS